MPQPENKEISSELKNKHKELIEIASKPHKDRVLDPCKTWEKYLDQQIPAITEDEHQSIYNYYFINLRKQVPELIPKEVVVKIKPAGRKDVIKSKDGQPFDNARACMIVTNEINNLFRKMEVKYDIRAAAHDLLVSNLACILVGNNTVISEQQKVDESMQALMEEKKQNGEEVPGEFPIPEKETVIRANEVVIKRVSYKDVMVDPDSVEYFFNDKRYVVRKVKLTKDEALAIDPEKDTNSKTGWEVDDKSNEGRQSAKKWVMYEIYEYSGGRTVRYRYWDKCAKFIDQAEFDYDPLNLCKINFLPDQPYPASDMKYYRSMVEESQFYRTVAMNDLDRASATKCLYDKDSVPETFVDDMQDNKPYKFIGVEGKNRSIDNIVKLVKLEPNLSQIQQAIDRATSDIRDISQINDMRFKPSNAPATNATISDQAFKSSVEERKDILKDWIRNITKAVVEVLKEISVEEKTIVIEQPTGQHEEITWKNSDIQHIDFVVDVDIEAGVPSDVKMNKLRDFINFLVSPPIAMGLQAEGKKLNFSEFIKEMGGYFMPDNDLDRFIIDANMPTPEQEDLRLMQGQYIAPLPNEDFDKHLKDHKLLLANHPIMETLPVEVLQLFEKHIDETMQMMESKQSLMKKQQSGPAMTDTRTPLAGNITGGSANAEI